MRIETVQGYKLRAIESIKDEGEINYKAARNEAQSRSTRQMKSDIYFVYIVYSHTCQSLSGQQSNIKIIIAHKTTGKTTEITCRNIRVYEQRERCELPCYTTDNISLVVSGFYCSFKRMFIDWNTKMSNMHYEMKSIYLI